MLDPVRSNKADLDMGTLTHIHKNMSNFSPLISSSQSTELVKTAKHWQSDDNLRRLCILKSGSVRLQVS